MAALSPAGQDRLLMLGIGLSTFAAIGLMRCMLVYFREEAAIPASENKPQYITQDVEDSLKLDTLDKLLDSPNYCITETTTIIICERVLHDDAAVDNILWHVSRPEHHVREKGIRALAMMMNSSTIHVLNKPQGYAALTQCLEHSITDYEHNPYDPDWDNWQLRDAVEQGCLMILALLVDKYGVEGILKSGFIERWLAKEPWGVDEDDRHKGFLDSMGTMNRLNDILIPLFRDKRALKQLGKVKLIPLELVAEIEKSRNVTRREEAAAGEDFDGMFVDSRRRRAQTVAEDHLRRRHREAMVLNDGTRPLERGDIIQRER